ncbi:MAG TPA: FAD-dependent oxidoreductase [Pirellula sp.]|nr:FAD-dependent oxidoreductase [Pirellula sp.]
MIVLGAGLAGSAVAWQAHWRGWSVAIIDRFDSNSSSRVAAGLVTPITGVRAAASWRWSEFYPAADRFYRHVERETGASFWQVEPALRVFRDNAERELFENKWIKPTQVAQPNSVSAELISEQALFGLRAPFGVCSFGPAARLDTIAYLTETQRYFQQLDALHLHDLNCDNGIIFESSSIAHPVKVSNLKILGKCIVFCQGMAARENRFFKDLPLHPARGDILVVQSRGVSCGRVIHRDAWAVPIGDQRFLVGATYERFAMNEPIETSNEKSNGFRDELIRRWEMLTPGTLQGGQNVVLDQRWGIRPASYDRHPLIGSHGVHLNAFCVNGLGSKGTLMAPRLAEMIIDAMEGGTIDPTLNRSRRK